MSLAVWSIALAHAFFVLIVADFTKRKAAVAIAAVISGTIGLLVGDPVYITIDLLGVAAATYWCWNDIDKNQRLSPEQIAEAKEKKRLKRIAEEEAARKFEEAAQKFFQGALVLGGLAAFIYWKSLETRTYQPPPSNTAPAAHQKQNVTKPASTPSPPQQVKKTGSTNPAQGSQHNAKKKERPKKSPVERCLELQDDQAMVACLENTP